MRTTSLAVSKDVEAKAFDGHWHYEYRLVTTQIGHHDFYHVEQRRMDFRVDGQPQSWPWERWTDQFDEPEKAIDEVIGDTKFFEAISHSVLHLNAVAILQKERADAKAKHEREARIATLRAERQKLIKEGNNEYSKAILKLGDNAEKIARTEIRLRAKYKPDLDRIDAELKSLGFKHVPDLPCG